MRSTIVVVGVTSRGRPAFDALRARLARPLEAPAAIASHVAIEPAPDIAIAWDKEPMTAGKLFAPPPGYHLLVEPEHFALAVNDTFGGPSIDALFESACDVFRERVVAVLLGDGAGDGGVGVGTIRAAGGLVLTDHDRTIKEIADALVRVVGRSENGGSR